MSNPKWFSKPDDTPPESSSQPASSRTNYENYCKQQEQQQRQSRSRRQTAESDDDDADLHAALGLSSDPPGAVDSSVDNANYRSMQQQHGQGQDDKNVDGLRASATSRGKNKHNKKNRRDSSSNQRQCTRQASAAPLPPSPPPSPLRNSSITTTIKTTNYRGFSTSVGDMFTDPNHERVDCCAMTCCGIFQSDRDRYLLQGVAPPSPFKRVWVHAVIPILMFLMAGYVALNIPSKLWNSILVLAFLVALVLSIVMQCSKGRHKRMDIRKDVLWYKYQLQEHQNDGSAMSLDQILDQPRPYRDDGSKYYRGQTRRDIGCAHPYCFMAGCYPNDRPEATALLAHDDAHRVEESLCSCIFKTMCGIPLCGMFCQFAGICGMAQESREIETTLLPGAYRRLDYVSMQPMLSYFQHIYNQRWIQFHTLNTSGPEGPKAAGPFQQWPHLSGLSHTILQGWATLTVCLGIWSVVGPLFWTQMVKGMGRRHFFSFSDFIVYLASWLVCLGTFAIVVYFCQQRKPLELSVDTMIKYFASGFALSTTLAIFYELAVGITLRLGMMVYMTLVGINVVEDNEYNMEWIELPLTQGFAGGPSRIFTLAAADGENYLPVFGRDHPIVYSIYLFINAYLLAALVEEICKYFGFRMIETPDLLSRQELEDAARAGAGVGDDGEESAHYKRHDGQEEVRSEQQTNRRLSFPMHRESLEAQGAAITVAMVCVALGFSLCEDLIYIFLYNGSSVQMELYVLIARTIFPIHPIAAALQSIGVVERDVEKCPTRFGRILLPAILFHGTYDFLLLWIDFLASLRRSDGYQNNDDETLEIGTHAVILSYTLSAVVMGSALYWFYRESNEQRDRLAARDAEATASP